MIVIRDNQNSFCSNLRVQILVTKAKKNILNIWRSHCIICNFFQYFVHLEFRSPLSVQFDISDSIHASITRLYQKGCLNANIPTNQMPANPTATDHRQGLWQALERPFFHTKWTLSCRCSCLQFSCKVASNGLLQMSTVLLFFFFLNMSFDSTRYCDSSYVILFAVMTCITILILKLNLFDQSRFQRFQRECADP